MDKNAQNENTKKVEEEREDQPTAPRLITEEMPLPIAPARVLKEGK